MIRTVKVQDIKGSGAWDDLEQALTSSEAVQPCRADMLSSLARSADLGLLIKESLFDLATNGDTIETTANGSIILLRSDHLILVL